MKRIAIVGGGVAGIVAAHVLSRRHQVTLFEANDYLGGHTHTVGVMVAGKKYAIDTGFIVYNDRTYPLFERFIAQLGVEGLPTEMSFAVSNQRTGLEYNGNSLATLFAQKRNLFNPRFYHFLLEILRFNKLCKASAAKGEGEGQTLGDFLARHRLSDYFAENYILAMGAAIWSTSLAGMREFPLRFFLSFFNNHGLLNIADRPQWYVVKGGSHSYVKAFLKSFPGELRLATPVKQIIRSGEVVSVHLANGEEQQFDELVLACHSDEALALLGDATPAERELLGQLGYAVNDVVLHTDIKLLPKRRKAWASWNYNLNGDHQAPAAVTYNMNILQRLDAPVTFCVTLNASDRIDPAKVLGRYRYSHPQFSVAAFEAQQRWAEISGINHTHFCGAYWFNGFHEDGVRSAVRVVEKLGDSL
ncbi:MAG: FAD-dependent oxidoreductase [Gammaproteobacteria bacterium]|nr:FAD-dependent oxidoreductase [Gammaproteobacteria bacterium]